jgi:pimeloyl-ACP methyl ester carboxylesterase
MEQIRIELPEVTLAALAWGPADGPLAILLHGFPDTAHTWRHLGPVLADAGWRYPS